MDSLLLWLYVLVCAVLAARLEYPSVKEDIRDLINWLKEVLELN